MANHLGEYLRVRRTALGLRPGDLARQIGYRNVTKGIRRVLTAEAGGRVDPNPLVRLATLLSIPDGEVERLADLDRRDWEDWADRPVRPHVVVRWLAAVYGRVELPPGTMDLASAEAFAARTAHERGVRTCLVWSRRLSVHFDPAGDLTGRCVARPGQPSASVTTTSGRAICFLADDPPLKPS